MTARPLLPSVTAALLLLLAANVLMAGWSHRLPYRHKLEEIRTAQNPNLLFVGNSLLDGRVDASVIEQAAARHGVQLTALDAALGATEPPEHLLLFDYSTRCHPAMGIVVVGIYDFQLSKPDTSRPADLFGNRVVAVDHSFSLSRVSAVYRFGPLQNAEFEAMRILPLLAYRSNAWKYTELLRRKMESMGMPDQASNSMGRVKDFDSLEEDSIASFDKTARAFLAHPAFNTSYETMFDEAQQAGMKPVIVIMPMSPYHRQVFYARPAWLQYLQGIKALATARGIQVIDASNWMPAESDFVDHLHMSSDAAHNFSARIGDILAEERDQQR